MIANNQSGVPFYIYSLAANKNFTRNVDEFGPICEAVMDYIKKNIEGKLNIKTFAKGYVRNHKFQDDHFDELLEDLKGTLRATDLPKQTESGKEL